MKWLIASDIHGSKYYCEKLIERINKEQPDRIFLLGDILYHGPRNDLPKDYNPKEVLRMLNEYNNIISVRGNCDSEVDQMVLKFPILADYAILDLKKCLVFLTHGHIYNLDNLPPISPNDILLCGHTHIQKNFKTEKCHYMNCGSISIPKEDGYHGYMTIEEDTFLWKNLEGTIIDTYKI